MAKYLNISILKRITRFGVMGLLRSRRCVAVLVFVALVLGCLVSIPVCAKKVTIRWMTWLAGDQLIDYKRMIDLFEKKNPDIEVKIESFPGDYGGTYFPKLLTMFAAGVLPDVLHTTLYSADELIEGGVLLDVAPTIKESGFDFKKYLPFSPTYVRGDKIWGGLEC